MKVLYLAWQDPESRQWYPVGKLTSDKGIYRFVYTKGATHSKNFIPFGSMRDLHEVYRSPDLFPLFANRLISKKRPEYRDFLRWLDLREDEADPLVLLARTEGVRATDSLTVFPCPEPDLEGKYVVHFFSHGLRHLPEEARVRINTLRGGERLYLLPDPQNPHDGYAIALRTGDPATIVGYCPRYISRDFLEILEDVRDSVQVRVKRVNTDAPIQLRLLCTLTADWPENFKPCSSEYYTELEHEVESYRPINSHLV
ncbi:MAG TPA: HIRAN domain-containing protein [Candidatus Udaeobacter sp.]|nr:HIRAN domain-containing protein [Candidatus Udaeobacter sp.]